MYIYRGKLTYSDYLQNEGITVIFPAGFALDDPVYSCWQWTKTSGGNKKESYFDKTTISGVNVTANDKIITYNNQGYYNFFVDISDIKTVSLTMIDANNTSVGTQLEFVYGQPPNIELDLTQPRIYMGKLSYGGGSVKYLDNETLVFVAPGSLDEGDTIGLFFQWTVTSDGSKNVNVNLVTPISSVTSVDNGESFTFTLSDYYTFTATVDETKDTLALQMSDPSGTADGTVNTTLYLEDLAQSGRVRRWAKTTEVNNNSSEIVVCALNASSSGLTDKILATASLIVGGVGLLVALPSTLPLAVGTYAAAIGWFTAVGGMYQGFKDAGEDVAGVLFPGDLLKRKSAFWGDNDLYINLARVENDTTLKISYAKIGQAGTSTLNIADLLPGGSSALTYTQQFAFTLPKAMKLLAYRIIVIQGLDIDQSGSDVSSMADTDVPNALSTFDKSTSSNSWYGTLDSYISSVNTGDTLFKYSSDVGLTFAQGVASDSGGSTAELLNVTISNGGKEINVLKLKSCFIENASGRPLEKCSKDGVTDVIARNGSYDAYRWLQSSSWLTGYNFQKANQNLKVTNSSTADDCVYFVPQSVNPVQSLIYK